MKTTSSLTKLSMILITYSIGVQFNRKLAFETMCVVLCAVSLRELVFWGWWNVYFWTPLCYFVAILDLLSQSLSIVLRCGVTLTFLLWHGLCPHRRRLMWPHTGPHTTFSQDFVLRVSFCCVVDEMLLGWICCTRLILTQITVCSASFHLLLLEFDILELQPQLIHCSKMSQPTTFDHINITYIYGDPTVNRIWTPR